MQEHKRLNITIISAWGTDAPRLVFNAVALNRSCIPAPCLIPVVAVRAGITLFVKCHDRSEMRKYRADLFAIIYIAR